MIELRHVRHLLAVASHPTVQAAADALHVTQPALTKSIARFEEQLGAKLFDRRGRGLVLTELGERLVERGDDLLRHARELEEEVALWRGIGTGEVAIGVDPESELSLLPGVLEAFVPMHPGVQVAVRSGHTETLLPALLRGDLHFLVADAELVQAREDLEIRVLATDPIAAAIRRGHPLARKRKPLPAQVAAHPFVGASTAPRFEQWKAERGRREVGQPFAPSLLCDNYEVLVRLAEHSDAIVFGPRNLLSSYERAGRLKVMSWPLEGPEIQLSLIRSRQRTLSPAAERLASLFVDPGASGRFRSIRTDHPSRQPPPSAR
jgi:DNA-binding transcriptional LysR family regulator